MIKTFKAKKIIALPNGKTDTTVINERYYIWLDRKGITRLRKI